MEETKEMKRRETREMRNDEKGQDKKGKKLEQKPRWQKPRIDSLPISHVLYVLIDRSVYYTTNNVTSIQSTPYTINCYSILSHNYSVQSSPFSTVD